MNNTYKSIIAGIFFIAVIFIYYSFPCLKFSFSNPPQNISIWLEKPNAKIIFLLGQNICGSCASGNYLYSHKLDSNLKIFVPSNFSPSEINNFRAAFRPTNKITKLNDVTLNYVKKLARCSRMKNWKNNILLELDHQANIKNIKLL